MKIIIRIEENFNKMLQLKKRIRQEYCYNEKTRISRKINDFLNSNEFLIFNQNPTICFQRHIRRFLNANMPLINRNKKGHL